ncbi:uncharacterized protein BDV14DRAFT_57319 [Aspergillus stella-maris]|uniref:uncharacterized protein n=1 Tax=Aspergillus stella-maris TaxID=1810926 RepID=UPI003CCCBF11
MKGLTVSLLRNYLSFGFLGHLLGAPAERRVLDLASQLFPYSTTASPEMIFPLSHSDDLPGRDTLCHHHYGVLCFLLYQWPSGSLRLASQSNTQDIYHKIHRRCIYCKGIRDL